MKNEITKINNKTALQKLDNLELSDLTPEQAKQVLKKAAEQKLINQTLELSKISNIEIAKQIETFLLTKDSKSTKSIYMYSLKVFLEYCQKNRIEPLLIKSQEADIYAAYCREKFNKNTANSHISAVSSFYSWMQKHDIVKNPFVLIRRSRRHATVKDKKIPSDSELKIILKNINPNYKLAIEFMAYRGFRVGALQGMNIFDGNFKTVSKCKEWRGELPEKLKTHKGKIFKDLKTDSIKRSFYRCCKDLYERGLIKHVYSVHDLRHYAAIKYYKKTRSNIYKLKIYLNHADIGVTETYLKGLDLL